MKKNNSWWVLILLAGVLFIIGLSIHGYEMSLRGQANSITVTGSAKAKVDSDLAKWTANFSRRANLEDLKDVLAKANSDTAIIRQFVTGMGLDEKAITFLPIQTEPVYEVTNNNYYGSSQNIIGYTIRQEVRVESNDIAKIDVLAKSASKLIDQGIVPEYSRTEYFYTKLDTLRPSLFAEATKDAKTRAEAIVGGTGGSVGKVQSARTGVIQILSPNSLDLADYGAYDVSTKEKEITATVNVSFEINK